MGKEVWMWLAAGLGYSAVNTGELLTAFPTGAQGVYESLGSSLLDDILTQKQAEKLASSSPADFVVEIAHAEAQGVSTLPFDDPLYPDMLRSISNPPLVLFVKGDVGLLTGQLSIGMVGARRPSAYGVEAVKAVGRGVALGGAIIVSGLAAGLDAEAHKAALAVNGPTIACIAFGHDNCYPAANKKLMEVIERYGAVISEYPLGTKPERPYFLHRNRIIAGLSHGLVICEARKQSGTMSTVNFAVDYGRDVFAVPGSVFSDLSSGTNAMIREGAYLAASAGDVLSVYGVELKEEDPVAAVARQAVQGRPDIVAVVPAPWQQSAYKMEEKQKEEPRVQVDYSQQTLGEALQSQLQSQQGGGMVSSRQAIDAFKKLQNQMPGGEVLEDDRTQALDEMAGAVSDSITFESAHKQPKGPKEEEPRIQPFRWDKVEHLSKKELERFAPEPEPDLEWYSAAKKQKSSPARGTGRVESVSRVEAVEQVWSVTPVAPAQPTRPAAPPARQAAAPAKPQPKVDIAAKIKEEQPLYTPPTGLRSKGVSKAESELSRAFVTSLSEKLRTMHRSEIDTDAVTMDFSTGYTAQKVETETIEITSEQVIYEEELPFDMDPVEAFAPDPLADVSEAAKKTYRQLGPKPVSLTKICEQSGLAPGEAMAALTELELNGLSRQLAGRQFVIMQ